MSDSQFGSGNDEWLLQCSGQVRNLEAPTEGKSWQLLYAADSGIPFVTDTVKKKWCMSVFQERIAVGDGKKSDNVAPELDISKVAGSSVAQSQDGNIPTPGMPGLHGHGGFALVDSMHMLLLYLFI